MRTRTTQAGTCPSWCTTDHTRGDWQWCEGPSADFTGPAGAFMWACVSTAPMDSETDGRPYLCFGTSAEDEPAALNAQQTQRLAAELRQYADRLERLCEGLEAAQREARA